MENRKKYDALILDVDGTLWDATETFARAYSDASKETAPELGITPRQFTAADIRGELGQPTEIIFRHLYPEVILKYGAEAGADVIRRLMEASIAKEYEYIDLYGGKVYPGVVETIRWFAERLPVYIVSNCEKGYIESFLKFAGADAYVRDWLCFGDTGAEKHETLRILAQKHGILQGLYVGDILNDAVCSKNAGMDFVWAAYGFGSVPEDMYTAEITEFPQLKMLIGS